MVDLDLENISMISTTDIDLATIAYVKQVEKDNVTLRNSLIITSIIFTGIIMYMFYRSDKEKNNKN
jgi:hypothetical protein